MAGDVRKRAELVELYFVQKVRMVGRLTQSEQPHRSKWRGMKRPRPPA